MKEVNASIITIGDELLIGQTIDTNSAFIAKKLNAIGIWVKRRLAIGDVASEITAALEKESRECQVIIITGGLGPTADDITKPTLCRYFETGMRVDPVALQNVQEIFTRLNRPLTERNLKQAEVPQTCTVLPNTRGTAPGMWFEKEGVIYVSLPGVPHEMKGLMEGSVIPALLEKLSLPSVMHRTLLTSGVGESTVADRLEDFEAALPAHIKLAYLPGYGMVRLRLTGRWPQESELGPLMEEQFEKLKVLVKEWMVTDQDRSVNEALSALLKEKGRTMCTAESCTGGYIAHLVTSKAGSSALFNGSVVAYSNEVKVGVLGVSRDTLQQHGAVSEQTVTEMVKGALRATGSDYAIATSGIMGPGGGSAEKPTGTVWIAVGNAREVRASRHHFRFDRGRNIEMTAQTALTLLFRFVEEQEG